MIRVRNSKVAMEIASERSQAYGLSAFPCVDGAAWLIGEPDELKRAGVPVGSVIDARFPETIAWKTT